MSNSMNRPGAGFGSPGGGSPGHYGPVGGGGYGPSPGGVDGNTASVYTGGVAGGGYGEIAMRGRSPIEEVFFGAACCIVTGSLLAFSRMIWTFHLTEALFMGYMLCFGLMLAILDTPILGNMKPVSDGRMYIGKYLQLMTRLTGKGIFFLFCGSALFMQMWDTLSGGIWQFLAVVICMVPALVGLLTIGFGIAKSAKLEQARKQLELKVDQRYDSYAKTHPGASGGLTEAEFYDMLAREIGITFDNSDLKIIFNALGTNPMWRPQGSPGGYSSQYQQTLQDSTKLSKNDLVEWCRGSWVFL